MMTFFFCLFLHFLKYIVKMSPNEAMHMLKDILILWTKDQGQYLNYKDSENKVGYFLIPHFFDR